MIYGEPINVLHRQELYRFDESTKQNGKHIFNPGFCESGRIHTWPRVGFYISPAKEKANWSPFVLISYAVKVLCVFSSL